MVLAVLADEQLKEELLQKKIPAGTDVIWADSVQSLGIIDADAYLDLLFEYDPERIAGLRRLLPRIVLVNSVLYTAREIGQPFIRINAWPTMLNRSVIELAAVNADQEKELGELFDALEWQYHVVPDVPGMLTPRIVSAMINEAWFTSGENASSAADALWQWGGGFPSGPFGWGKKIGLRRIGDLLSRLARTDQRYTPAPHLNGEF